MKDTIVYENKKKRRKARNLEGEKRTNNERALILNRFPVSFIHQWDMY